MLPARGAEGKAAPDLGALGLISVCEGDSGLDVSRRAFVNAGRRGGVSHAAPLALR